MEGGEEGGEEVEEAPDPMTWRWGREEGAKERRGGEAERGQGKRRERRLFRPVRVMSNAGEFRREARERVRRTLREQRRLIDDDLEDW